MGNVKNKMKHGNINFSQLEARKMSSILPISTDIFIQIYLAKMKIVKFMGIFDFLLNSGRKIWRKSFSIETNYC